MATKENHETCNCAQCKRSEKILQDLLSLHTESLYYDCTLSVGTPNPQIIKGHKMILARASLPFANMLYSDFTEGKKGKDEPISIEDDISPEAFDLVLRFIYGKVCDFPEMSIACEVYKFAHKWLIEDLMNVAAAKLKTAEPDEILPVYEMLKLNGSEKELKMALRTIEKTTSEVLISRHWIEAAPSTIIDIFKQPILTVESEKELFDALIKWGKANSESVADLQSIVTEPLKLIRFRTMNPKDFAELCSEHADVFSLEEKFQILMSIALGDQKHMPSNFTIHDKKRMKNTYYIYRNYDNEKISTEVCCVNSASPPSSFTFSLSSDFPNYVTHVILDCLCLQSNYGLKADLICSLTELKSGKQVGAVKFKGKINKNSDKELIFIQPVRIEKDTWYELSVKYFNRDLLCSKNYVYDDEVWKGTVVWDHESSIMNLKDSGKSQCDVRSVHFFYDVFST